MRRFPLVVLVWLHQSAEGKLAVVAVLLTEGKVNPPFHSLCSRNLPKTEGSKKELGAASFNPVKNLAGAFTRRAVGLFSLQVCPCLKSN